MDKINVGKVAMQQTQLLDSQINDLSNAIYELISNKELSSEQKRQEIKNAIKMIVALSAIALSLIHI